MTLEEIYAGLSRPQKEISSQYFYDERGSELFEAITALPEYYLTRTESTLLQVYMPGWLQRFRPRTLVELGAGSAAKTRVLLDATEPGGCYVPVDVSAEFLDRTAQLLRSEYPALQVAPVVADIGADLDLPLELPRPALFAFLGSTIGNFEHRDAVRLLRRVCEAMQPGDRFVLGVDLQKDPARIEAAYNDAQGVTAEFNRNALRVLNREVGADFDPDAFLHCAFYDAERGRIEMHLVAKHDQEVAFPGKEPLRFQQGETIRTEISCKYNRPTVEALFAAAGLRICAWHTDPEQLYALVIGVRAG